MSEETNIDNVTIKEEKSADSQNVQDSVKTSSKKEKKNILKSLSPANIKAGFRNEMSNLQANGKSLFVVIIIAVILMLAACCAVFFATVRGPEQVMVPNVVGKDLTTALLEMQVKELYPKIQLRYTDSPDDAGKILTQSPDAGAIVKAGRRISLTVSRGVIIDKVENYIGMNIDEVKINLQTMFTGSSRPLIVLAEPSYKPDQSDAGTILAQDPPEGTDISNPVTVKLVVSRGPEYENTRVPKLVGLSVDKILASMAASKIVFEFISHVAADGEKEGTVTEQEKGSSEYVKNFARVKAEFSLPKTLDPENAVGIYRTQLTDYPYPVQMSLEGIDSKGTRFSILNFQHTGGVVTIPYNVPRETELILSVAGKTVDRQLVE